MEYIRLYEIRKELKKYYEMYHQCSTVTMMAKKLSKNEDLVIRNYSNPFPPDIAGRSDEEFITCFTRVLFPLTDMFEAISRHDQYSYYSESIFSSSRNFRIMLQENFNYQGMHSHDYFEITYVFRGKCTLRLEKETLFLSEGNVCILTPETMHEAIVLDESSLVLALALSSKALEAAFAPVLLRKDLVASYIQSVLYQNRAPYYLLYSSKNSDTMKKYMKQVCYENRQNHHSSFSTSICWLSLFLNTVTYNYQSDIHTYDDKKNSVQANYMLLLEYIQNNFQNITLQSTADFFHYNKSYLSRLIKELTGKTFINIISELKLSFGKELLENTKLNLDDIAAIIGYNSGDYFSKAFKHCYKISCDQYRNSLNS